MAVKKKAAKAPAEEVKTEEVAKTEEPKGFVVAKGKSVTSLVGILNEGDKVEPKMFQDGKNVVDRLLRLEVIIKV